MLVNKITMKLNFKRSISIDNLRVKTTDLRNNAVYVAETLKSQSDSVIDISVKTALERNIQILKMAEEKIKAEGMSNVEIKIALAVGPIQIDLSKNVE